MTVIIGLVDRDSVYIGGDSGSSTGWDMSALASPKVFRLPKAKMLVGGAGTFRYLQIVRYHADMELSEGDAEQVLVSEFIPALRETAKTHGWAQVENAQETSGDSGLLVGFRGRLFNIDSCYGVAPYIRGFDCIGSGGSVALGAMAALRGQAQTAEECILRALEITSEYVMGICPPFVIQKL